MNYKLSLLLVLSPALLVSQEKLNKLKSPTSPASSVLGLQPSTVLSPKSYQALETALYSSFLNNNGGGVIPNDFALEFTPYWTKNHGLSLSEYLYPKNKFDQFIRNSSFSVASTKNFLLGDSTLTNGLAFGYRTTFYFGNNKDREKIEKYRDTLRTNQKIQAKIVAAAENLINQDGIVNNDDFLKQIRDTVTKAIYQSEAYGNMKDAEELTNKIYKEAILLEPFNKVNPDLFLNSFYAIIDKKLNANSLFNKFKTYIKEREGLSVDIAYANLLNFPTNNFEFSLVPRQSFWITPTFRLKDEFNFVKVMGVLRYEWYNTQYYKRYFTTINIYENNIDYGLSISTEFKKFAIQFEMVGRKSNSEIMAGVDANGNELFRKQQKSDFQYIGSFNYNLTDQIVISYSLGKRFEPIQNPVNTLVSLLSLNLGFGAPTDSHIDLEK